jgi:hypothetical protein
MHDVLWPYGRRDLYYVPERVPEEFRQPYEMKGIRPGTKRVLPQGGLNPLHSSELGKTTIDIDTYGRPSQAEVSIALAAEGAGTAGVVGLDGNPGADPDGADRRPYVLDAPHELVSEH